MRIKTPSRYTDVTQEQFDRFKRIAKAQGLIVGSPDDNTMWDGISVHTQYDAVRKELTITAHEPFWMAPGVVTGALHEMAYTALYAPLDATERNDREKAAKAQVDAELAEQLEKTGIEAAEAIPEPVAV